MRSEAGLSISVTSTIGVLLVAEGGSVSQPASASAAITQAQSWLTHIGSTLTELATTPMKSVQQTDHVPDCCGQLG